AAFCGALLGVWNARSVWRSARLFDPPEVYSALAARVRGEVPAGTVLFTDDPFVTEILISYLPEYRYIVAYDPAVLYLAGPERFWRWHHAAAEGSYCELPSCGSPHPSGAALIEVLRSFDTR